MASALYNPFLEAQRGDNAGEEAKVSKLNLRISEGVTVLNLLEESNPGRFF